MQVSWQIVCSLIFFCVAAAATAAGVFRCRKGQFYADTFFLFPLGIFVWGDALILGPFWGIAALTFPFLSLLNIARFFLIFYAVRHAYEVVYWLNHQATKNSYRPPMFRQVQWLQTNDVAILYQLMNMCVVVACLAALLVTFS